MAKFLNFKKNSSLFFIFLSFSFLFHKKKSLKTEHKKITKKVTKNRALRPVVQKKFKKNIILFVFRVQS